MFRKKFDFLLLVGVGEFEDEDECELFWFLGMVRVFLVEVLLGLDEVILGVIEL